MISRGDLHNARSVVRAWRDGKHRTAWAPAANDAAPSDLNHAIAEAHRAVMRAADDQAARLLALGFLPGHTVIRDLRTLASQEANKANYAERWARALEVAEMEP